MTLTQIWSGAVEILNGESRECQQMLIRDVVDDKNPYACDYLHLTMRIRLEDDGSALDLVEKFLRTITHAVILDSLSVDTYIGNLYNMISGARGERAVAFFSALSRNLLVDRTPASPTINVNMLDNILTLILEALYQLLCREKRASFHEDLPQTFTALEQLFGVLDVGGLGEGLRSSRKDCLQVLCRIVKLSNGLIQEIDNETDNDHMANRHSSMTSVYPVQMQLPGGRHDTMTWT